MNRPLALQVIKFDKHLWQRGLLKIKCSRAAPSNDFIFNNPLAIGLYVIVKHDGLKFLKNNVIGGDSRECIIFVKLQCPEVFNFFKDF